MSETVSAKGIFEITSKKRAVRHTLNLAVEGLLSRSEEFILEPGASRAIIFQTPAGIDGACILVVDTDRSIALQKYPPEATEEEIELGEAPEFGAKGLSLVEGTPSLPVKAIRVRNPSPTEPASVAVTYAFPPSLHEIPSYYKT